MLPKNFRIKPNLLYLSIRKHLFMIPLTFLLTFNILLVGKIMVVVIIAGFMPLSAFSFFKSMLPKKEQDYKKAMNDMGINTEKQVRDVYTPIRYLLPVSFVTIICLLGAGLIAFNDSFSEELKDSLILTGAFFGDKNTSLILQSLVVVTYAFLGSFIWSSFAVTVRLFSKDLVPSVYYRAGIRMILAVVIALIISFLIGKEGAANLFQFKSSLVAIAFLSGMFPERFLQYMINLFKKFVDPDGLNTNELSLYRIEGITMSQKERLEEIGITNAQNLATYSLTQLCIETPFESRTLLDWIGQAKLLCYLKEDIDKLRGVGIRSVFDLVKVPRSDNEIGFIADAADISETLLKNVNDQVLSDKGILALAGFQDGKNTPTEKENNPPQSNTPVDERIEVLL